MNRQKSFENQKPTLYVVATPIGNLQEMTPRAIEILNEVDVIACEDTRVTQKLLSVFNIKTPLFSHHAHNQEKSISKLLDYLEQGQNVALVSDAGYPLISDPGDQLVSLCVKSGFNVVPVSGSSAFLNGLVVSGLLVHPFLFHGFLPSTTKNLKKLLLDYKGIPSTLIFYVSVHKLESTLSQVLAILGDRQICLARELTKKHEEIIRGHVSEILLVCEQLKGEFVLIVEGNQSQKESPLDELEVADFVEELIEQGYSASKAIKEVSQRYQIAKNEVYRIYHDGVKKC